MKPEFLKTTVLRAIVPTTSRWDGHPSRGMGWSTVGRLLKAIAAAAGYYDRVTFFTFRRMVLTEMDVARLAPGSIKSTVGRNPKISTYLSR